MKAILVALLFFLVVYMICSHFQRYEFSNNGKIYELKTPVSYSGLPVITGIGMREIVVEHYAEVVLPPKIMYIVLMLFLFIFLMLHRDSFFFQRIYSFNWRLIYLNLILLFLLLLVFVFSWKFRSIVEMSIMFLYNGFIFSILNLIFITSKCTYLPLKSISVPKLLFIGFIVGCSGSIEFSNYFAGLVADGVIGASDLNLVHLTELRFGGQILIPGYVVFRGLNIYLLLAALLLLSQLEIQWINIADKQD